MTAQEKFSFVTGVEVISYKAGCAISLTGEFFRARRKVMRGLEEHLVKLNYPYDEEGEMLRDHDFINGSYFYKITNAEKGVIYVKFEGEWVTFGSSYIY